MHGCTDGFLGMEKHENFTHDGSTLVQMRISLPTVIESSAITEFYEEMGTAAHAFCRDTLAVYAKGCYDGDPDPRKYLHFSPFRFFLTGKICYQRETILSVRMEAMLLRQGRKPKTLCGAHNFSVPDGLLLSPRRALAIYFGEDAVPKRLRGAHTVLLTERAPLLLRDGIWVEA